MHFRNISLLIVLLVLTGLRINGQTDHAITKHFCVPINYGFSGITNSIFVGYGFFQENNLAGYRSYLLEAGGGVVWNTSDKAKPFTAMRVYVGSLPGIMVGISSQQYYNMITDNGKLANDIRLSGEVILALFGFIGYRYQHPIGKNESKHISRHAITVNFPIPLKKHGH